MDFNRCQQWMVIASAFYITLIASGNHLGFGVFFNPLIDTFGRSRSLTAMVNAILRGVMSSFGILAALITAKLGITKTLFLGSTLLSLGYTLSFLATSLFTLYVTIGLLGGCGSSLLLIASITAVGHLFRDEMRGVALSIQTAGINIAGMLFPEIYYFLLRQYGLNGAFLVPGGIYLNGLIASQLIGIHLNRGPTDKICSNTKDINGVAEVQKDESVHSETSKYRFLEWINLQLIMVILGTCVCFGSNQSILGLIVDIFIWKGIAQSDGVTCLLVTSLAGLCFRMPIAFISYVFGDSWTVTATQLMVCSMICCIGICTLAVGSTSDVMMVGGAVLGAQYGTVLCTVILIMEQVPKPHIAVVLGCMHTGTGIVVFITGPLFGAIYDWTTSYMSVLIVAAGLHIVSCALYLTSFVLSNLSRNYINF